MYDSNQPAPLQFDTAEYSPEGKCSVCSAPLGKGSYRINGATLCSLCGQQKINTQATDDHAAFVSALVAGLVGAFTNTPFTPFVS